MSEERSGVIRTLCNLMQGERLRIVCEGVDCSRDPEKSVRTQSCIRTARRMLAAEMALIKYYGLE